MPQKPTPQKLLPEDSKKLLAEEQRLTEKRDNRQRQKTIPNKNPRMVLSIDNDELTTKDTERLPRDRKSGGKGANVFTATNTSKYSERVRNVIKEAVDFEVEKLLERADPRPPRKEFNTAEDAINSRQTKHRSNNESLYKSIRDRSAEILQKTPAAEMVDMRARAEETRKKMEAKKRINSLKTPGIRKDPTYHFGHVVLI